MADFKSVHGIKNNIDAENNILRIFLVIYEHSVKVKEILARYQTDPAFKAEADHLFTSAQLAELGQMIADVNTLQAQWEINHKSALGLAEQ